MYIWLKQVLAQVQSGSKGSRSSQTLNLMAISPTNKKMKEKKKTCRCGCGSKLTRRGYAGFGPCFHLPGFHFGTGFLSHGHAARVPTTRTRALLGGGNPHALEKASAGEDVQIELQGNSRVSIAQSGGHFQYPRHPGKKGELAPMV